jgi:DNA-binding SARP family transcriptional activator
VAQRRWQRACALYEHAIGLEPLSEYFYCRAMVCLREQGRRSEAVEVYRRLRHVLSVTLGVAPAAQAVALFQELIQPEYADSVPRNRQPSCGATAAPNPASVGHR